MARTKRVYRSPGQQQEIAEYIVRNQETKTLKQVAFDLAVDYFTVARIFRERVNVSKRLSLRYPDTTDTE